jgi:hypothetical protein
MRNLLDAGCSYCLTPPVSAATLPRRVVPEEHHENLLRASLTAVWQFATLPLRMSALSHDSLEARHGYSVPARPLTVAGHLRVPGTRSTLSWPAWRAAVDLPRRAAGETARAVPAGVVTRTVLIDHSGATLKWAGELPARPDGLPAYRPGSDRRCPERDARRAPATPDTCHPTVRAGTSTSAGETPARHRGSRSGRSFTPRHPQVRGGALIKCRASGTPFPRKGRDAC